MVAIGECYNIIQAGDIVFRPADGEHYIVMAVGCDNESAANQPDVKAGLYNGVNVSYIYWPTNAYAPFTKFMINHDVWLYVSELHVGAINTVSLMRIR